MYAYKVLSSYAKIFPFTRQPTTSLREQDPADPKIASATRRSKQDFHRGGKGRVSGFRRDNPSVIMSRRRNGTEAALEHRSQHRVRIPGRSGVASRRRCYSRGRVAHRPGVACRRRRAHSSRSWRARDAPQWRTRDD